MNKPLRHAINESTRQSDPDWVVFDIPTGQCLCQHCGATLHFDLPQPMAALAKAAAVFDKIHRHCPAPATEVKK